MWQLRLTLAGLAVGAIATISAALAADAGVSKNVPVTKLKFFETGVGPLQAASAYGDLQKGEHATYIKMPAGYVSPPHTHTEGYFGIVISGVGANGVAGAPDVELPVGSYWYQKAKEAHVTKCLSANECIFFIGQPGKFDYLPVK